MREYLSLQAAARDALDAVCESDLAQLEALLGAVTRAVRRDLTLRDGGNLDTRVARHPVVLLVRARISDLTGAFMGWPIPYTSAREAACMLAFPNWQHPRSSRIILEPPNMPAPWAVQYIRVLAAEYPDVTVSDPRRSGTGNR